MGGMSRRMVELVEGVYMGVSEKRGRCGFSSSYGTVLELEVRSAM